MSAAIVCKMIKCPFHSSNQGFCAKKDVVGLDQNGMCTIFWNKGQPKRLENLNLENCGVKEEIKIINEETTDGKKATE